MNKSIYLTLFFSVFLLICGTVRADWIDSRESPLMYFTLHNAGVEIQYSANGESLVIADDVDCQRSTPAQGDSTVICTFSDQFDSKTLTLDGSAANIVFTLTGHFGGTMTDGTTNGVDYQEVKSQSIDCRKLAGENEGWLCDVL